MGSVRSSISRRGSGTAFSWVRENFPSLLIGVYALGLLVMQRPVLADLHRSAGMPLRLEGTARGRNELFLDLFRRLDKQLPPRGRFFVSGIVGPEHGPALHAYYCLVSFLFPRRLDISLGQRPYFTDRYVLGVDTADPAALRRQGYDYWIRTADGFEVIALQDKAR